MNRVLITNSAFSVVPTGLVPLFCGLPKACALGCILSPLRGWEGDRWQSTLL